MGSIILTFQDGCEATRGGEYLKLLCKPENAVPCNLYSIIIGLLCFDSCFHGFQFINIFHCLQFYILFRYKDIYMHKVVLKTTMPASWYSKDNSPAMVRLKPRQYLFFPGQKIKVLTMQSDCQRPRERSHLNDEPVHSLTKMMQECDLQHLSNIFSSSR